jgi:hypothetical protein
MNRNFPIFPKMTAGPWLQLCSVRLLSNGQYRRAVFLSIIICKLLILLYCTGGSFPADRWVILPLVIVKPN